MRRLDEHRTPLGIGIIVRPDAQNPTERVGIDIVSTRTQLAERQISAMRSPRYAATSGFQTICAHPPPHWTR